MRIPVQLMFAGRLPIHKHGSFHIEMLLRTLSSNKIMLEAFMLFRYKPTLFQESHKNLHSQKTTTTTTNNHQCISMPLCIGFYLIRLKSCGRQL